MKWNLLPHAQSDYIFAIIGEELGFLGCLVVVTLYGVLAYAGFRIARRSADRFVQLASVAITVWLVGQAAMNMGYVVGLLPVTGVQLPLISAGGTSLVLTLFIVGLLARFARVRARGHRGAARPASAAGSPGSSCPCPNRPSTRCARAAGRRTARRPDRWSSAADGTVVARPGRHRRARRDAAGRRPPADAARRQPPPGAPRRAGGPAVTAPLSVVLAGGGPAGHIEPMLALADALRRRSDRESASPAWVRPEAWRPGWCPPAATTCG